MVYVLLGILLCIVLYGIFCPRVNTIYKNKYGAQVLVTSIVKTCVIVQYVKYNKETGELYAITGPQNVDLWDFILHHRLWIML